MKGVVIEKATCGNILDVYALFKDMAKEGAVPYPKIEPDQVKEHYFRLLNELSSPQELYLLARRGRTYWGFLNASLAFRPFGVQRVVFIKNLYVAEKKRKMGIAKQLYETARTLCKNMGISQVEFMCQDQLVDYWEKKVKAKRVMNFMTVEI